MDAKTNPADTPAPNGHSLVRESPFYRFPLAVRLMGLNRWKLDRITLRIDIPWLPTVVILSLALVILYGTRMSVASGIDAEPRPAQSASPDKTPPQTAGLPLNFERHTGDLDTMVKRGDIRALVLYSRSGFFYVNGRPEGIYYEALREFEQFVNQKLHTGKQHVQVTFIPVRPDQVEADLTQGVGDLIAY
jgi:hypothetical protein